MSEKLVTITDAALVKVKELLQKEEEGKGLRLGVKGGGCSGFSYSMTFDFEKERDNIVEFEDVRILLDPKSTIYLKGIQLDHESGLEGKGFVFKNPNFRFSSVCCTKTVIFSVLF